MRITPDRYVKRTVNTPSPTKPKQKYRLSLLLCIESSAMTRFGSANAYCTKANGTHA
jgi:hypothetical protein